MKILPNLSMNEVLHELAEVFRQSAAGKSAMVKDYTLELEMFLRRAGWHDGNLREWALDALRSAERASDGVFLIDRHRKTGEEEGLRLKREAGESWLFASIGMRSPSEERQALADWLTGASSIALPETHLEGWTAWLDSLASQALAGNTIQPFRRGDEKGNLILLEALEGILAWQGESSTRYASVRICGDSKALETLRPRLLKALSAITGREGISLEDFGITDAPRLTLVHGPLLLKMPEGTVDFGLLSGPAGISECDLAGALDLECRASYCLTVENVTVFHELAKRRAGLLLVQTSFPGAATRMLFSRLPQQMPCGHFGDTDPAGFDILRDLREKTGRQVESVLMEFRESGAASPLSGAERRCIGRLLTSETIADTHPELRRMLEAGSKGDFEHESVSIDDVLASIPTSGNSLGSVRP